MTTLIQLRTRVQDHTHRPVGPSTEIDALVNDAIQAVVMDMRTNYQGIELTLVPQQSDYSLATDLELDPVLTAIKYVEYGRNGVNNPLNQVSFAEMLRYRSANSNVSGAAPYYYSFVPPDSLSLYPTPSAGDTATLWGWFAPALLDDDSDEVSEVFIPGRWVDLVVLKACITAARSLNQGRSAASLQMSSLFRSDYQTELALYRRERNTSGGSYTPVVEYGPRRAPRTANDVYLGGWN